MVNFAFFSSRTFLGANIVGFIVSFAMLAQFFFLALYLQNILHFSPLQAGIRFLPSTVVIIIMGPLAGRLSDRVGSRPLMTLGLLLVSAALFLQSGLGLHTSYLRLVPGFVLMGIGIGLVMSPMSTAAMNAVDRTKAGVASGTLSMSRMVGGTFGVAVMGALITTIGGSKINASLPHVPAAIRSGLVSSLGDGGVQGQHAPAAIVHAVQSAFVSSLGDGLVVGGSVAACAAVIAWVLIRRTVGVETAEAPAPELPEAAAARELSAV